MIKVGYFLLLVGLSFSLAKGLLMINQLLDWRFWGSIRSSQKYGLRPLYRLSKEQCWTSPCPSSRCLPEIWQTSRGDICETPPPCSKVIGGWGWSGGPAGYMVVANKTSLTAANLSVNIEELNITVATHLKPKETVAKTTAIARMSVAKMLVVCFLGVSKQHLRRPLEATESRLAYIFSINLFPQSKAAYAEVLVHNTYSYDIQKIVLHFSDLGCDSMYVKEKIVLRLGLCVPLSKFLVTTITTQ